MSFFVLIRVLFMFVVAAAFKDGELSVNKPTFNPFKLLMFVVILTYIFISMVLMTKMMTVFARVESTCPGMMRTISTYKEGDPDTYVCTFVMK